MREAGGGRREGGKGAMDRSVDTSSAVTPPSSPLHPPTANLSVNDFEASRVYRLAMVCDAALRTLAASPPRVDERTLIRRVLAGDVAAERELYDAHVDRVYRLAFRFA